MVDAIGPSGQIQNVSSANKTQNSQEKRSVDQASANPSDEVSISTEALSLSDAEGAAQNIASTLSQDASATLSNDSDRLNQLL